MAEDSTAVLFQVDGAIARITLNRPEKRNALNGDLVAQLKMALRRGDQDKNVRVVVLSGAGVDFCSGADLESLKRISEASVAENLEDAGSLMELFMLIRAVHVPVIAAVRGHALAGGCGLALACDLVLASKSARFGFPEVKIGFVPAMVTAILRRSMSEKRAFELLTLGSDIAATQAAEIGLINRAFDDATFDSDVERFAKQFEKVSRSAVGLSKQLFHQTDAMSFEDALQCGADANVIARMTKDCREGISRFLAKKPTG